MPSRAAVCLWIASAVVLATSLAPASLVDQVRRILSRPAVQPARTEVLLVSSDSSLQIAAAQTLRPRGRVIRVAQTPQSALAMLRAQHASIGTVLVDGSLPKRQVLLSEIKSAAPGARPLVLENLTAETLPAMLVSAGLD
ncbi:MAG TPA: hypothetical protein VJ732_12890 [Bryobacteraceae bacterium]|nr:hypothetical protein [Bryobacteraceae bacterium]